MCLSQTGLSDCEGAAKNVSPEVGIEGRMGFSAGEGTRFCGRKGWLYVLVVSRKTARPDLGAAARLGSSDEECDGKSCQEMLDVGECVVSLG